ncbi:hypothetical protein P5G61_13310 [Paenibacillus sp. F6_3S_P_1C]|uniref:ABC transmembrane type-1 domain-containing protein n=1 Tax=Paenibacillus vandeheii TaxID=3035917 RepID=A0ABT8JC59_9BACL|nr:hypothetical protein [Paenibacillus vandeheii]MDN4602206.1 hypothetical protein [Paenibacillus vandeheii]
MNTTSEVSGLMEVTKERKGLLITASIFSILSSLLQMVPFIGVYKIVEELLIHARQPSALDNVLGVGLFGIVDSRAYCTLYWGNVLAYRCVQHSVPAEDKAC